MRTIKLIKKKQELISLLLSLALSLTIIILATGILRIIAEKSFSIQTAEVNAEILSE